MDENKSSYRFSLQSLVIVLSAVAVAFAIGTWCLRPNQTLKIVDLPIFLFAIPIPLIVFGAFVVPFVYAGLALYYAFLIVKAKRAVFIPIVFLGTVVVSLMPFSEYHFGARILLAMFLSTALAAVESYWNQQTDPSLWKKWTVVLPASILVCYYFFLWSVVLIYVF